MRAIIALRSGVSGTVPGIGVASHVRLVPKADMAYSSPTNRCRSGSSKRVQNDPNIEPIAMTAVSAISAPTIATITISK